MSRILTHREIKPRRPDCLADETVSGEPVSVANSLLENAGNFCEFEPDQAKGVWLKR
jgi:hypothetical protein